MSPLSDLFFGATKAAGPVFLHFFRRSGDVLGVMDRLGRAHPECLGGLLRQSQSLERNFLLNFILIIDRHHNFGQVFPRVGILRIFRGFLRSPRGLLSETTHSKFIGLRLFDSVGLISYLVL